MKKVKLIMITLMMGLSFLSFGQNISEVIVDSTKTKEVLYSNAVSFFKTTFKSDQTEIQIKDPESGRVNGKLVLPNGRRVIVNISCKNGRYKYGVEYDDSTSNKLFDLNINKCGTLDGKTYIPIKFLDGKPVLDLYSIYFTATGQTNCTNCWSEGEFVLDYDGDNNILGLSKSDIEKWVALVNKQFQLKEIELNNIKPKKDVGLDTLILCLKDNMSKNK